MNTIFDERYYDNLPGGLLEAFGRGFGHAVKMYVYPAINVEDGALYDLSNIINGDIQKIIDELMLAENTEKLKELGDSI